MNEETTAAVMDALDQARGRRVLVIGDIMLDLTLSGPVERISPEGLAPVLRAGQMTEQLGGAARVALYARRLGAEVTLVGVVGGDQIGARVKALLRGEGIDADHVQVVPDRPTTVKTRYVGERSGAVATLLRVDVESRAPVGGESLERLQRSLKASYKNCHAVVMSDYAKGVCTEELVREACELATTPGVKLLVDPAWGGSVAKYVGADFLMPNRDEAEMMLGRALRNTEDEEAAARRLAAPFEGVLLKLDRGGMLLARKGLPSLRLPSIARRVVNVSGAGDMVAAACAVAVAGGAGWSMAAETAAICAGMLVERSVDLPVTPLELAVRFSRRPERSGKLRALPDLLVEREEWREAGMRVVLSNGCFDLMHAGHVAHLDEAARLGDVLVVALNGDASVRRVKGLNRPIVPQADRAAVVAGLECVDRVVLFDEDTPHDLLRLLRPEVLAKGGTTPADKVEGSELLAGWGGRVMRTSERPGLSTTGLIAEARRSMTSDLEG